MLFYFSSFFLIAIRIRFADHDLTRKLLITSSPDLTRSVRFKKLLTRPDPTRENCRILDPT